MLKSWKRIAAALVALVCAAALAPAAAQACSCVPRTPETVPTWLREGRPAVIGEVVAVERVDEEPPPPPEGEPPPPPDLDTEYAYTVRVERAFNADLGTETTIVTRANGGLCGITFDVGQRFGAFLGRRADGAWGTGLCSTIDPTALIAAAEPPPPPPPVDPPPTPPTPPTDDDAPKSRPPAAAPSLRVRFDGRVAAGGPRNGVGLQRLPVAADERIRLSLGAAARSVRFGFADASGGRVGALRSATTVARSGRKTWTARLPRALPRRADRLLVVVELAGGRRAVYAIGLGQPARVSASSPGLLPCPFAL